MTDETHYFGDGHDHGDELGNVPDQWNPNDECLARRATRQIIGVPPHTHVCRKAHNHLTVPVMAVFETEVRRHKCGCGDTW